MKRPRVRNATVAATLLATACSFPSAASATTYADYNHTARPIDGGFRCTAPGGGGSAGQSISPSRTLTPFHLLQFCFVPDQSAFLYLHIDYGDGQTGQFGAQVTQGVEYCRPTSPKPILGNSVRHAHVEFDDVRVVQATILSSAEGCLVFNGKVTDGGGEDESVHIGGDNSDNNDGGNITAVDEAKIKWLYDGDSSIADDESSREGEVGGQTLDELLDGQEDEEEEGEDMALSEEMEERIPEHELDFEIVPPSRYGESLGPVQAIIGLDRGDDVASGGERAMPCVIYKSLPLLWFSRALFW